MWVHKTLKTWYKYDQSNRRIAVQTPFTFSRKGWRFSICGGQANKRYAEFSVLNVFLFQQHASLWVRESLCNTNKGLLFLCIKCSCVLNNFFVCIRFKVNKNSMKKRTIILARIFVTCLPKIVLACRNGKLN